MYESGKKRRDNPEMIDHGTHPDIEVRNEIVRFVRNARVAIENWEDGNPTPAKFESNVEAGLRNLAPADGLITNHAGTVALITDPDDVDPKHAAANDDIDEPATVMMDGEDDKDFDYLKVKTAAGTRTAIKPEYIDLIDTVYEVNLRKTPYLILGHAEDDGWPVRVESPETNTALLVAPIVLRW